jgi:D-serine deaminase-like pyridoxal phosphate-dependent protein
LNSAIGLSIDELDTPALIIDLDKLEFNVRDMAEFAKSRNINLRPHIKTHKSPDIAQMQINHGASGIACAKIGEAQVMAAHNIRDIHVVYPVVGRGKVERIIKLMDSAKIIGLVDCYEQARCLFEVLNRHDTFLDVTVAVDVGLNREGIQPEDAAEFFRKVSLLPNINVIGISTHAGHVYAAGSREEVVRIGKEEGEMMVGVAEELRRADFDIEVVSVGSTPTAKIAGNIDGVTEIRPGNYVFYDAIQAALGVVPLERCALKVLTTIVSRHSKPYPRLVIDAGSKALTLDKGAHGVSLLKGYGVAEGYEDSLLVERLSEEHGVVRVIDNADLGIGDRIEIIPNHACGVVNQFDVAYGIKDEEVVKVFNIEARGRFT